MSDFLQRQLVEQSSIDAKHISAAPQILQKTFGKRRNNVEGNFFVVANDQTQNPLGADAFKLSGVDVLFLTQYCGKPIMATPHIGRHWESNSAYKYMGVVISDFTGNQSVRDTEDEPEHICVQGQRHNVITERTATLSPYLSFDMESIYRNNLDWVLKYGNTPAQVHHAIKKQAIGEEYVRLDTQFLWKVPQLEDILNIVVKHEKEIFGNYTPAHAAFNRFVNVHGEVSLSKGMEIQNAVESFIHVKQAHEHCILNDTECMMRGALPAKEVMIMCDVILCLWQQIQNGSLSKGADVGYAATMSGVSMVWYTKRADMRAVFERMYQVLRCEFSWLPKKCYLFMIPGGMYKFLPSIQEHDLLEATQKVLDAWTNTNAYNAKIAAAGETEKWNLIASRKAENTAYRSALDEFRTAYHNRKGYSQYDLLASGDAPHLGILSELLKLSYEQIWKIFQLKKL